MKPDATVIIGKIGATYGVQGWLKITSYTEVITDILDYNPWLIGHNNHWQTMEVNDGHQHGKGIVVKLAGINNPEQARLLTGKMIAVKRANLPSLKKNEFYWSDLEGLTVIDQHQQVLGTVSYLIATGGNDVLVVKTDHKEIAIPYLPDVVVKVDLAGQVIQVNWDPI